MHGKVVIFGNAELAELNHFYLTHDSPYEVVAFTVDGEFIAESSFCGLPVVPFDTVENVYAPAEHRMSLLAGYRGVNQFRAEKFGLAKTKGYRFVSYTSSKAITWPGLRLGENSYICENVVVQPFAAIGDNVIVAPGAVIGHHSTVRDHCFIASGASVLGEVNLEPYCVLGGNCTIADGVTVGRQCVVGANTFITRDSPRSRVYVTQSPTLLSQSSDEVSALLTWSRDAKRRRRRERGS